MNALFDPFPRFSSIREVEEWEHEQNTRVESWVANEENDRKHREKKQRVKDHIKSERERLERTQQERLTHLNAVKEALAYSEPLAQEICERIASGELLTVICRDDRMPTMRRCNQWLKEHQEFKAVFEMSLQDRLFVFEEQVVEIADDMRNDFKTILKNGKEKRVADPDMVARAKLRIEVRFRHLRAGKPQKWGETSTLITKDANDFDNMTTEEIEKKLADLEAKDRVVREPDRKVA